MTNSNKRVSVLTAALLLCASALFAQAPVHSTTQDQNIDTYVELLRQDIKSQKVAVISVMMNMVPEEASAFWLVYKEYDQELTVLVNDKLALIKDYADHYSSLSDEKATELASKVLDMEEKRTALKRKYLEEFGKVLPGKAAARFLQIENQLLMLLDLQVASNLPIVR